MIDFIKIELKNIDIERLLELPYLDFIGEHSPTTGEVFDKKTAKYHFSDIVINKERVLFKGSIHKLWNSLNDTKAPNYIQEKYKGYNGNQFNFGEIISVRNHLTALFDCEPYQMVFQNLEFGINANTSFDPKLYLNGLLCHKRKQFESDAQGNYKQIKHQQYALKIYNKSNQYSMNEHTLRVELKIVKSIILHKMGIKTFADITKKTLNECSKRLLREFNNVLHYDYTINTETLLERHKKMLLRYANPNYWINEMSTKNHVRPKARLKKFTHLYSDNLHKQVEQEIINKIKLNNTNSSITINHPEKVNSSITFNSSNIVLISAHSISENEVKKCKVTGLDISMQKQGSLYLSHTGLRWYFKHQKKTFDKIANKYLSEKWSNSDFNTQIKELAHNIRTVSRDIRRRQEKIYTIEQYRLFNIMNSTKVV